jgi:pimeloyl-ACP methyl ester carboxylesterase
MKPNHVNRYFSSSQNNKMNLINHIFLGAENRKTLLDFQLPETESTNNLILFIHGYKGYKDWGAWNLVQSYFVQHGIGFAKINLSHNGGTTDNPIDFPDLEAFGENRYTFELEDITAAIETLDQLVNLNTYRLWLIGHSRGGGDVILSASHPKVYGVITWASICDIGSRFPTGEELANWRKNGVRYVENGRTKQLMPHHYTMYLDWEENKERLDIEKAAKQFSKPILHIHGNLDDAVGQEESEKLSSWTKGKLHIIHGANHTFGASHPWEHRELPQHLFDACKESKAFIETH